MRLLARARALKPAGPKPPPLTINALRKQLPEMAPEDREATQRLLADESALKKALEESAAFEQPQDLTLLVTQVLESAESLQDLDRPFWTSVKDLIRETSGHRNIDKRVDNIPLFVRLFQLARDLNEPERSDLLYRTGSYIYRLKMLRFDPINEAEYLDALAKRAQPIQAVTLWKSRKDRTEVADSVYWWDIGILYHLEAKLVQSAQQLAREMLQKFSYVSPRALVELIKTTENQEFWVQCLLDAKPRPPTDDFTKMQTVTPEHFAAAFKALLATGSWQLATKLLQHAEFTPEFELPFKSNGNHGDINALAAAAVERHLGCLEDPAFFAFWILHHLKAGNIAEASDILLHADQVTFSDHQVVVLAKHFEALGATHEAEKLVAKHDTPGVATKYLHHLARTQPARIAPYIESINCDLEPELAQKILELGGQIEYPLVDLGRMGHGCWKQFWPLLRDGAPRALGKVPTIREALEAMFQAANFYPSLNLFETVLQASIAQGDLNAAVAVLSYMERKHELSPNLLLFGSIKAALGPGPLKHSKVPRGDIPWPKDGPLAQPIPVLKIAEYMGVNLKEAQDLASRWP